MHRWQTEFLENLQQEVVWAALVWQPLKDDAPGLPPLAEQAATTCRAEGAGYNILKLRAFQVSTQPEHVQKHSALP